ncbi:hypothetical protein EJ06DRAFT_270841 [Trichodelitschia bisporula]|uniref:Uncharacterized protein n=1 Tax=Trichodelitschia bisporula TaxID=703511 RepID=A0A6G1HHP6_9PEZI|nr:hypothetical protein EJ06DRAFT_270841 [Trichodelitschia bisporula]
MDGKGAGVVYGGDARGRCAEEMRTKREKTFARGALINEIIYNSLPLPSLLLPSLSLPRFRFSPCCCSGPTQHFTHSRACSVLACIGARSGVRWRPAPLNSRSHSDEEVGTAKRLSVSLLSTGKSSHLPIHHFTGSNLAHCDTRLSARYQSISFSWSSSTSDERRFSRTTHRSGRCVAGRRLSR